MGKTDAFITIAVGTTLRNAEKTIIEATLQRAGGNISHAAKMLGVDRSTLYGKIVKHKIVR